MLEKLMKGKGTFTLILMVIAIAAGSVFFMLSCSGGVVYRDPGEVKPTSCSSNIVKSIIGNDARCRVMVMENSGCWIETKAKYILLIANVRGEDCSVSLVNEAIWFLKEKYGFNATFDFRLLNKSYSKLRGYKIVAKIWAVHVKK